MSLELLMISELLYRLCLVVNEKVNKGLLIIVGKSFGCLFCLDIDHLKDNIYKQNRNKNYCAQIRTSSDKFHIVL